MCVCVCVVGVRVWGGCECVWVGGCVCGGVCVGVWVGVAAQRARMRARVRVSAHMCVRARTHIHRRGCVCVRAGAGADT